LWLTVSAISLTSRLGIGISQAVTDAAQFTDIGGDGNRAPNELYKFGRTVLIHTSTGTTIKNIDSDESIADVLGIPMTPAVVVDIAPIIKQIDDNMKKELKNK
jgi:hypothetical protein